MLNLSLDPLTYVGIDEVRRGIVNPTLTVLRKGELIARFSDTSPSEFRQVAMQQRGVALWTAWAGSPWWIRRTELIRIWTAYTSLFTNPTREMQPISVAARRLLQLEKEKDARKGKDKAEREDNDAEVIVEARVLEDITVFVGRGMLDGKRAPSTIRHERRAIALNTPIEQLYVPGISDPHHRLNENGRKALCDVGFLFLSTGPI